MEINKIYCGDNVELIKEIDTDQIDLTVTSPPYDGLRKYNGYSFDFESLAVELFRVTKPGGVVVWVVADQTIKGSETGTSFKQALFFMECGFNLHDTMIYQKFGSGLPHNDHRYGNAFEYMFVFSNGKPKKGQLKRYPKTGKTGKTTRRKIDGTIKKGVYNIGGGVFSNIWQYAGETKVKHPAPFPEALARDHILSWSNPGDLIFDPFMGSGTTAKMAKNTGRDFIGFEISQEYVDISNRRIRQEQLW
jgi:site-specific DNA-methyltransferase (adenine-specific)